MKRDKFITIQEPVLTMGESGGTREIWVQYWSGWARIDEKGYNTAMEEGQFVGNKMITVQLWKNGKTDKVNTAMRIAYRSKNYLINSIRELDRFTLEVTAMTKESTTNDSVPVLVGINTLNATLDFAL